MELIIKFLLELFSIRTICGNLLAIGLLSRGTNPSSRCTLNKKTPIGDLIDGEND